MFLQKTIDSAEIDFIISPKLKEIDQLKLKEVEILQEINEEVQGFRRSVQKIKLEQSGQ